MSEFQKVPYKHIISVTAWVSAVENGAVLWGSKSDSKNSLSPDLVIRARQQLWETKIMKNKYVIGSPMLWWEDSSEKSPYSCLSLCNCPTQQPWNVVPRVPVTWYSFYISIAFPLAGASCSKEHSIITSWWISVMTQTSLVMGGALVLWAFDP